MSERGRGGRREDGDRPIEEREREREGVVGERGWRQADRERERER